MFYLKGGKKKRKEKEEEEVEGKKTKNQGYFYPSFRFNFISADF